VRLAAKDDHLTAHLISDADFDMRGILTLELKTFEGESLWRDSRELTAPANKSVVACECRIPIADHQADAYVHARFEADQGGAEGFAFFAEPKDWRTSEPRLRHDVVETASGELEIVLKCERFAPYVWIDWDGPAIALEDNFFHLQPGEERRVKVIRNASARETASELVSRLRLRSL
jgi:hypothetical protein